MQLAKLSLDQFWTELNSCRFFLCCYVFFCVNPRSIRLFLQVLEDTGDAATQNVDRVKKENARVSERLRKKRVAMFASWCMMFAVSLPSPLLDCCIPMGLVFTLRQQEYFRAQFWVRYRPTRGSESQGTLAPPTPPNFSVGTPCSLPKTDFWEVM